jgi:hypothetical protein
LVNVPVAAVPDTCITLVVLFSEPIDVAVPVFPPSYNPKVPDKLTEGMARIVTGRKKVALSQVVEPETTPIAPPPYSNEMKYL